MKKNRDLKEQIFPLKRHLGNRYRVYYNGPRSFPNPAIHPMPSPNPQNVQHLQRKVEEFEKRLKDEKSDNEDFEKKMTDKKRKF
ncbi:hypothetical protein B9Z55_027923 [Caenorhabditis nigoni]|uniref:Uncharacterized protein n=1 Tax=Caenorhabditis nigoni TaxID=1611254 RepID=A0A2G5SE15_9PELO|nr:hypothetical protein B9Z55_027923 [Caenorhabditis nigoni]